MTVTTGLRVFPLTRTQCLLCNGRWLFFGVGILAIVYSGFTLLDAWLYQASAMRSLDRQGDMQPAGTVSPLQSIKDGDVLARLTIPRLGISVAVLQGTTSQVLRLGAGHITGTVFPGEPGNSGIAAHRDTFFRGLKGIRESDEIQLQTTAGLVRYEVDWAKVVASDDISVLAPSTESALTLVTCYPFYFIGPAPKRFVVHAQKR